MRVAVLGAGVVGVSTAWHLLKDGHEVVVVDRAPEPSSFSSFANAGCVGAGYAFAWGSPRAFGTMLRSALRRDQMVRISPMISRELMRWLRRFRRECTAERAASNTKAMARLCRYSQTVLGDVVRETGIDFDRRTGGLVYFFRAPESLDKAVAGSRFLVEGGVEIEPLNGAGVHALLGALGGDTQAIAGGLLAPNDESGDARLFTLGLADCCRDAGAEIRLGETISRILTKGGKAVAVETDQGTIDADAIVVCLGVFSRALVRPLLRPHGIDLPVYPVKGYSATLPVRQADRPPAMGGVDVDAGLAFAPMGERLRITRTIHFAGYSTSHRPADFRVMLDKANAAFPSGADYGSPTYWAGLRPMTPSGLPIIDRTPIDGLWVNTGQGNFGWTAAAGSGRLLSDLLSNQETAIQCEGLSLSDHQ